MVTVKWYKVIQSIYLQDYSLQPTEGNFLFSFCFVCTSSMALIIILLRNYFTNYLSDCSCSAQHSSAKSMLGWTSKQWFKVNGEPGTYPRIFVHSFCGSEMTHVHLKLVAFSMRFQEWPRFGTTEKYDKKCEVQTWMIFGFSWS